MTETLRATCPCGYENRVPEEKRGQTITCASCGHGIQLEVSATEFPDVISVARPRSPFEADESESEMIPTANPRPVDMDLIDAMRPKDARNRHVFVDTISPSDMPTGEKCVKCGRALRGSWDRVEIASGVSCHICSNLGEENLRTRPRPSANPTRRMLTDSELSDVPPDPEYIEPDPSAWNPKSRPFKRAVFLLSIGTLIFSAYVMFINPPFAHVSTAMPSEPMSFNQLSFPVRMGLMALGLSARFVPFCLALYLGLSVTNSLPNKQFATDLVYVATGCAPFVLLQIADLVCASMYANSPETAGVVSELISFATALAILYVINQLIEIGGAPLVATLLLYGFLNVLFLLVVDAVERNIGLV